MMISNRELRRRVLADRVVEYSSTNPTNNQYALAWLLRKWRQDYEIYKKMGGELELEFGYVIRKISTFCRGTSMIGRGHAK